jgi:tRNA dimethylallyltransferase
MTSPGNSLSSQTDIPAFFIMGPTASGKSSLAFYLAQKFNGEIISADSMQIYRGLDIGTAKPSAAELATVPHHLLSIFDFNQRVDVFTFIELAKAALKDIRRRGKIPIVAGGTGMYLHTLLYGIDDLPGNREIREQLDREYDHEAGFIALKELMRQRDPVAFELWQMNRRKLIRALEVLSLTGKSITELQTGKCKTLKIPAISWSLSRDRDELKKLIATRTEQMLAGGWIEEAELAIKHGLLDSPTARQALGYRIIAEYLAGSINYKVMKERITTATWQLARRQITWFKNQHPEAEIINMPVEYCQLEQKFINDLSAYGINTL